MGRPEKIKRIGWTYPADQGQHLLGLRASIADAGHGQIVICTDLGQLGLRVGERVYGIAEDGSRLQPILSQQQQHPLQYPDQWAKCISGYGSETKPWPVEAWSAAVGGTLA